MFNSGFRGRRAPDDAGAMNPQTKFVQTKYPVPAITGWSISGSDDTALNPAGGQTVLVNGTGFATGCAATLNGVTISPVTLVNSTQISFTAPANSGGSYTLIVYNSNGGAAILVPGLTYSSVPTWTTAAGSIGTYYETTPINSNVVATSDSALTYSLSSGSLPSGATLYANGVITGTAPVDSGSTTYTFAITATDAELQDVTRTFTMTINVDVVTWVTPSSGATLTTSGAVSQSLSATDAAGYAVSYTANALPAGLTLSGNTISGTATTNGSTSTLLTATAATTGRTATNTVTWVVTLNDSYFQYDTILLSANASIQTSSFVTDNSLNNTQITVVGDTRAQPPTPLQAGYFSNYFDGSGDYLSINYSTNPTISGDFTWETWVYETGSTAYGALIGWRNTSASTWSGILAERNNNANNLSFTVAVNASTTSVTITQTSGTYTKNAWHHVAITRSGTTVTLWIDGVSAGTGSLTGSITPGTSYWIGSDPYNNVAAVQLGGYISNQRFVSGVSLYNASFTPPTTPLLPVVNTQLLTCQSYRLADSSINNFTVTKNGDTKVTQANPFTTVYAADTQYYSAYFDGTGDYLSTAVGLTSLDLTSGDFTLECWVYNSGAGAERYLFSQRGASSGWEFRINATNLCQFFYTAGSSLTSTGTITGSTWTHLAVTRSGTTVRIFINGALDSSATFSNGTSAAGSYGLYIGYGTTGGGYMLGCISNARINKGQALYTAAFTPATSPLTTTSQGATASNVSLLTCQSSTLIDNSTNAFAITAAGDVKPLVQSPFLPVYYSNYFDGSGDYLSITNNAAFTFDGDFTIECWVNSGSNALSNSAYPTIFATSAYNSTGIGLKIQSSGGAGTTGVACVWNNGSQILTGTTVVSNNTWYHLAVSRSGTSMKLFVNGTAESTITNSTTFTVAATYPLIGADTTTAGNLTGYISNLRVLKGQALYTSNFTPSTAPLTTTSQGATAGNVSLLTCQSLYFIDTSNNKFTVTPNGNTVVASPAPFTQPTNYTSTAITTWGSGYFDGTGDYLNCGTSGAYAFGTGAYTVEFWVYHTSVASIQTYNSIAATGGFQVYFDTAQGLSVGKYGSSPVITSGLSAIPVNQWLHISVSRVSTAASSTRIFVNGIAVTTGTDSNDYTITGVLYIGSSAGTNNLVGYMSNFRIVKGTALYTAAFVPSFTTPLTAVTNTQLLTLQTNGAHNDSAFLDSSMFNNLLTRGGNATNGTFSPYGDNWSNYFDGSGDYLTVAAATALNLTSGDFTIELWFYCTAFTGGEMHLFNKDGVNSVSYPQYAMAISTTGVLTLQLGNGNGLSPTSTGYTLGTISANTWYHAVGVRTGTTIKTFLNGTQVTSTAQVTAMVDGGKALYLGFFASGVAASYFNGYISNFRITKGQALYTSNFTPSTAPLTLTSQSATAGNVSLLTCQSNRLVDNSNYNFTITKNGDTTVQKFNPFATVTPYTRYYSNSFDGTGDYLTAGSTAQNLSGDFTLEAWVFQTIQNSYEMICGDGPDYFATGFSNTFEFGIGNSSYFGITSGTSVPVNQWNHVAVTRSGTTLRAFLNGTLVGSTTTSLAWFANASLKIGQQGQANYWYYHGNISNFRIVKGQALYTSNFTPSTTPLTTTSQGATAANVSLLTCQSSTFIDNSLNALAITASGDTKPLTQSPFAVTQNTTPVSYSASVFGGSMYFDGNGDYLTLASSASLTLTGSFTIEFWAYPFSTASQTIVAPASGADRVLFMSTVWGIYDGTAERSFGTPVLQSWQHVAVSRSGTTIKCFLNGVLGYSGTDSGTWDLSGTNLGVRTRSPGGYYYQGYLSNLSVVNGQALYTASFSPAYAPSTSTANTVLLLGGTAGGAIDASRTVDLETVADARVTQFSPYSGSYYSNYFDGTGDYLSTTLTAKAPGTGDFTYECWFYVASLAAARGIMNTRSGDTTDGFDLSVNTNGAVGASYSFVILFSSAAGVVVTNTWYHIAVVRTAGTTITVYLNGTSLGNFTSGGNTNFTSTTLLVGSTTQGSLLMLGYISNFRYTKGQALYTTTFTPSTTPLTTTSQGATAGNVSLLTCQSNKIVDNSTNAFTVTRNGDVKVQTQNPWQTNTGISYYFDGTGDSFLIPSTPNTTLAGGDFTIECWFYANTVASNQMIFDARPSAEGAYPTIYITSSATVVYYTSSAARITSGTIVAGTWYYLAVVRSSGSTKMYLNGTQAGSTYTDSATYLQSAVRIGSDYTPGTVLNGYISDFRLTKGYARYTTTFTPPTTPLNTN